MQLKIVKDFLIAIKLNSSDEIKDEATLKAIVQLYELPVDILSSSFKNTCHRCFFTVGADAVANVSVVAVVSDEAAATIDGSSDHIFAVDVHDVAYSDS